MQEIESIIHQRRSTLAVVHSSGALDSPTSSTPSMVSMPFGRGSEGSRGIIAFYYTFLHTVRRYSSCGSRARTAVPYFLDFAKSANISALSSLAHRLPTFEILKLN